MRDSVLRYRRKKERHASTGEALKAEARSRYPYLCCTGTKSPLGEGKEFTRDGDAIRPPAVHRFCCFSPRKRQRANRNC